MKTDTNLTACYKHLISSAFHTLSGHFFMSIGHSEMLMLPQYRFFH